MDIVDVSDVAVVSRAAGFELLSPELFNEFHNFAAAQSSVLVERNQELVGVSRGLSSGAKWGIARWEAGAAVFAGASYHAYQAFNKFHTIFDQLTSTIIWILSYIVFLSVVLIQKESIHLLNHGCAEFFFLYRLLFLSSLLL